MSQSCAASMIMNWGIEKLKITEQFQLKPVNTIHDSFQQVVLQSFANDFNYLYAMAQTYDIENNEPHCELDSKKKLLKELADKLNVKLNLEDIK